MKKWEKRYFGVVIGLLLIVFVCAAIFRFYSGKELLLTFEIIISVGLIVIAVMVVGYFLGCAIFIIKKGMHNIKIFDDEVFREIDKYKKSWTETKVTYTGIIRIIKFIYGENGEVDKLVDNKEIDRLYARADFLSIQSNLFEYISTVLLSLAVSVIASLVIQMMNYSNTIYFILEMIIIPILILVTVSLKFVQRGKAGSYLHYVDDYERNLLMEKIKCVENTIKCTMEDKSSLETKCVVREALLSVNKREKMYKKKEVESDIKIVEQLDLCLERYDKSYKKEVNIYGVSCYLLYDEVQGKENDYMGELNLITEDYVSLYRILVKYKLI